MPRAAVSFRVRARIHLIIAAHLCMSPRGQREALALQSAGFEVTLSGVWFDPHRAEIDGELMRRHKLRFRPAIDLRPGAPALTRLAQRAKGRWARARFGWTRGFSPALLGYGVQEQLDEALRVDADLTIVHSEAGLWTARQLLREGRRVGVDFEDWFSRDLPHSRRAERPLEELSMLEREVLGGASYRLASSQVMAQALADEYHVPPLAVVTNAAGAAPGVRAPSPEPGPLRLHWFSQTIGPARGLELLFAALPLVHESVSIELRGGCSAGYRDWLEGVIPADFRARVILSDSVPPWELPARIAQHDVGLALETSTIPSRDLCIPNKLFHYFASGLAVIATATQGHREAMSSCPEAGILVDENSPHCLAAAINRLARDRPRLAAAQAAARSAALGPWSGDREREVIIAEARQALHAGGHTITLPRLVTSTAAPPPEIPSAAPPPPGDFRLN